MVCSVCMIIEVISHILLEAGLAEKIIARFKSYLFSIRRIYIWYCRIAYGAEFLFFYFLFVNYNLILCCWFNLLVISKIFVWLCNIKVSSMYFVEILVRYLFLPFVIHYHFVLLSLFCFILLNFKMSEWKF